MNIITRKVSVLLFPLMMLQSCGHLLEPQSEDTYRSYVHPNTSLSHVIDNFFSLRCSGYFENCIEDDSATFAPTNTAMFCNSLGDEYIPEPSTTITVNGTALRDSILTDKRLEDHTLISAPEHTYSWIIPLHGTNYYINSSISMPAALALTFPPSATTITLPQEPVTITYQLEGADSVYIKSMIINSGWNSPFYFDSYIAHVKNTGSFYYDESVIAGIPDSCTLLITIAAANTEQKIIDDKKYLFRAGRIDHAAILFSK